MAILITGVAGFIGSNLARKLLNNGQTVIGIDNLCRGTISNISNLSSNPRFSFFELDASKIDVYRESLGSFVKKYPITSIWHLAANSDIAAGVLDEGVDLRDTFLTTFNTLLLMREFGIKEILFASSSAIYGDFGDDLISEKSGPLFPCSNYGAMKLASEAIISAALESHLDSAYIFRFPNVVGTPATHGVIVDFIKRLKECPSELHVLGDGSQQKSYLHVNDLIDSMLFIHSNSKNKLNFYNIGPDDFGVTVREIAEEVVSLVSPLARIIYGSGNKGWVGDVPKFYYSVDKLRDLGWPISFKSSNAIAKAIREIALQEGAGPK